MRQRDLQLSKAEQKIKDLERSRKLLQQQLAALKASIGEVPAAACERCNTDCMSRATGSGGAAAACSDSRDR